MRLWLGLAMAAICCGGCGRTTLWGTPEEADVGVGGSVAVGGAPSGGGSSCANASLELRDFRVLDADGDGRFAPGEQVRASAQIWAEQVSFSAYFNAFTLDPALMALTDESNEVLQLLPDVPQPVAASFVIAQNAALGSEYRLGMSITSTSSSPCFATDDVEQTITVSATDDDFKICDVVRQFRLSNAHTVARGGDRVHPGDDFELRATLTNPGPQVANGYPGMTIESSDPDVRLRDELSEGWWFGIGLGSIELSWQLRAARSVPRGTLVNFVLYPAMMGVRCVDVAPFEYSMVVD